MNQRTGAELGTQVWVGSRPLTADAFMPVEANGHPWMKPRKGGLWTAQWDEQYGGGWVQWCYSEDFEVKEDRSWEVTLLEPEPEARVLVIDSYEDLERVYARWPEPYPADWPSDFRDGYPAWHLVAEEVDGVHLTEGGQWRTRMSSPLSLYGWDCESTLWFRWAFDEIRPLGQRTFESKPWSDDE